MNGKVKDKSNRMQLFLIEKFINGINDDSVTREIMKEVRIIKNTSAITSGEVLLLVKREEAQRSQTGVIENF